MARIPCVDVGQPPEQVAELVGSGQQHHLGERVDLEGQVLVAGQVNHLGIELDRQFGIWVGRAQLEQLAMPAGFDGDRQQAVLQGIASEDVGEAGRQDGPDAPCNQRPRSMLARRPGPEVVAGEEDPPARHLRAVEDEGRVLRPAVLSEAPVMEERFCEPVLVGDLQISRGHDLVRVDVFGRQRDHPARERLKGLGHRSADSDDRGHADARQCPGIGHDAGQGRSGGGQWRRQE